MLKQNKLSRRKFFKQKYYHIKYRKQSIYIRFLQFLAKNMYIEKQIIFLAVYYLSFLLRISSISNLLKQCQLNYSFKSVGKLLKLNRLTVYENISIGNIPGFKSASW